jgi:ecotin
MPTPPSPLLPLPSLGWALLSTLTTASLTALASPPARALPMKKPAPAADLKPFPAPAAGEVRWVVRLPKEPPASPDPALSAKPRDSRVELIVGREVLVDCNLHVFNGTIKKETIQGWGYPLYRVTDVGAMASTRKACPPDQPKRRVFVPMGTSPYLIPYNAKLPVVLYTPADMELRWRLWRAEENQQPASRL